MHRKLHRFSPTAVGAAILLIALAAINSLALWGIVAARREARRAEAQELELRALAQARALEAAIASLRADLLFLSKSPTLVRFVGAVDETDPLVRRWGRLDAEGTVLLFLEAHAAIEHLALGSGEGTLLRAGRLGGAPLLLPLDAAMPSSPTLAAGQWSLAQNEAQLETRVDPQLLLSRVEVEGVEVSFVLDAQPAASSALETAGDAMTASVPVTDQGWTPPLRGRLVRREQRGNVGRSLEAISRRFGATVALNLAIMASSLPLGWIVLRNLRREAAREAERAQQERVRALERQVQHSERLASVGRLAAGFAHEINNPLEGISNYLAVLRDELDAGRAREARPVVDRVAEGVDRAAGVIRQILTFSESGSADRKVLDLREVLESTAAFVRSNPRYRDRDLHLELAGTPIPIRGNAVTLGQLVLNLLLNALQAEPARGPIELAASTDDGEVLLEVRDRGPGLPATVRDRLFEPFTSTRGSTGLGLAVCSGIVADHGGRIDAHDREGGGTVFAVRLPGVSGSEANPPLRAAESVE